MAATSGEGLRDKISLEILQSEQNFVGQMQVLVSVFIKPLKLWAEELKNSHGKVSMHPMLPEGILLEIFANVEQLLLFNQHLVEEFAQIYKTTKAFGGYFRKAAPFFKMYSLYVSNYDRAMEALTSICETRLDFSSFVRACELQEACKGLNLRSYLIMPVQRIPRYKLLLMELLKHTPETHPDYQDLVKAVALVSEVVNSINEDVRKQERRFKVVEAQEKFDTTLVTASRLFVKDGLLVKMCRKGPKMFFFVLFNDLLVYGSEKMLGNAETFNLHRKLDLNEMVVADSGDNEKSFMIATKAKSFVVQCKDLQEKASWLQAFQTCFSELEKTYATTAMANGKDDNHHKAASRLTTVVAWMRRDAKMVQEVYRMPEGGVEKLPFGIIQFNQMRLVPEAQANMILEQGGIHHRVRSLFKRDVKNGENAPLPCEIATSADMSDDASVATDATSPTALSDEASPSPHHRGSSRRLSRASSDHEAELISLNDLYTVHENPSSIPRQPQRLSYPPSYLAQPPPSSQPFNPAWMGGGMANSPVPSPPVVPLQPVPQMVVRYPSNASSMIPSQDQQWQRYEPTDLALRIQQQLAAFEQESTRTTSMSHVHRSSAPVNADGSYMPSPSPPPRHHQQQLSQSLSPYGSGWDQPLGRPSSSHWASGILASPGLSATSTSTTTMNNAGGHNPRNSSSTGMSLTGGANFPSPFDESLMSSFLSNRSREYTAVIPVTDMGLGLFLRDEGGQVVIGGFRPPKAGAVNPSQRAGVRVGDILVRVHGTSVSSVAETIAALRKSRLEQVIALTLRKADENLQQQLPPSQQGERLRAPTGGGGGGGMGGGRY